jgi:hypothetical protein
MYGHRTGQLQVLPFTYLDAARFHPGYLSTFRISERREIPVELSCFQSGRADGLQLPVAARLWAIVHKVP